MKKVFAWFLRIACLAVIGAAVYTLVISLMHVGDDYSAAAILGNNQVQTFQGGDVEGAMAGQTLAEAGTQELVDENPTIIVYTEGVVSAQQPYTTVTAAFGNIVSSVVADISWFVDDELVAQESQRLLVEGSTVSYKLEVDMDAVQVSTIPVSVRIEFDEKSVSGQADVMVEASLSDQSGEETVVIRTEEIPVTAQKTSKIYKDSTMTTEIGQMERDAVGLLLGYEAGNNGLSALRLLMADGTSGWVDADHVEISQEDCTTDEDYADQDKMDFVNNMLYDSQTGVLVWVSLYTQKVNVFNGYQGNWVLVKSFDCATGVNTSPTTTGSYHYAYPVERWDLGSTYVEPVLVFNGGEAFTSQPYDTETGEIADDTMGEPASGGSVRMLEEDLAWLSKNLPLSSLVIVY